MGEWAVPGYTELKSLGSGGFGTVKLARHDATGTAVAIKYLRPDALSDPEFASMFRSEAVTLGSLDDANVVRLYEYVESPAGAAIVMELVDGVTVREILKHQGKTTAEAALVVLYGSLLGLAAAHARGVVHRDYKPENVLVNGYGASKLTDFGIAARTGTLTVPVGTLAYAPPEQFDGAPATPATDVYAAAATFYECLTGHPPFTGDTTEALLRQHRTAEVPLEPVPEPLRPLVRAGMAKDPRHRPESASALAVALRSAATGAYGEDWESRGRSHLGEAALLLAALWPSAGVPALQGFTTEQVHLSQSASAAHHPQPSEATRHRLHLWHVRHEEHVKHLRYLRSLRTATAVAAGVAVIAAGVTVAATGHSANPPGSSSRAARVTTYQLPLATIPATASSSQAPVTGDVYVQYHDGADSTAKISGQVNGAASGEVVRLYAQQFPFTSAPSPAGSLTLASAGSTAYTFQVTPALATRYQVKLFPSGAATAPSAISPVTTIYVISSSTETRTHCDTRPVCHITATDTFFTPPSALATEMSKTWYTYFALNLSPSNEPPVPATMRLGAGDFVAGKPQRTGSDEFTWTYSLSWTVGNDAFNAEWNECTKDTEAEDGVGLPGSHGCGDESVPSSQVYLG